MNQIEINKQITSQSHSAKVETWKGMFSRLWGAREILEQLIIRSISVRYRQSFLGYIWAISVPVIIVLIFTYITSQRVLPIGALPYSYPAFAIWNLAIWQLFSGILVSCSQSLTGAGAMTTKINFAKETLVLSAVGQPLFDFIIKLPVIYIVFLIFDAHLATHLFLAMIVLIPVMLFAVGLGFFVAVLNLVFRDTEYAVSMIASFGIFLAPILYPAPGTWPFSLVNILNPFSPFLVVTQNIIATATVSLDIYLLITFVVPFVVFMTGWRIFTIVLPIVIEKA